MLQHLLILLMDNKKTKKLKLLLSTPDYHPSFNTSSHASMLSNEGGDDVDDYDDDDGDHDCNLVFCCFCQSRI